MRQYFLAISITSTSAPHHTDRAPHHILQPLQKIDWRCHTSKIVPPGQYTLVAIPPLPQMLQSTALGTVSRNTSGKFLSCLAHVEANLHCLTPALHYHDQ